MKPLYGMRSLLISLLLAFLATVLCLKFLFLQKRMCDMILSFIFLKQKFVGMCCRYVMDELGSSLRHSDDPNFRISPFLYMPEGNLASAVRFSSLTVLVKEHRYF